MGEKTGLQLTMLIFAIFIIPILITSYIGGVKTSKLLTESTEIQQLVSAEGGVTDTVYNEIAKLEAKGFEISFKDSSGNPVTGKVPVGEKITIDYKYDGKNTSNQVLILKR